MPEQIVVDEVWVIRTGPATRLFMQWDAAVPYIREMLRAGERIHIELAPVIGGARAQEVNPRD